MQLTTSVWHRLQSLTRRRHRRRIVVALLGVGILLSGLSARALAETERARHQEQLDANTAIIASRVNDLADDAVDALESVRPLWQQRRAPTAGDFAHHLAVGLADPSGPTITYAGLTDIAFVRALDADGAHRFARRLRDEQPPRYDLEVTDARPHYVVDFHSSDAILGTDLYPLDGRRAALEAARDRAVPVASPWYPALTDLQLPAARQRRLTMIAVPVYRGAVTPRTTAARRQQLIGWLVTPLLADTVVQRLAADLPARVELHGDGTAATPIAVAGTDGAEMTTRVSMDVLGRPWSLTIGVDHDALTNPMLGPTAVLAGSLCLTAVLIAMVWLTSYVGARSESRASMATARLRERDEYLRVLHDHVPVGMADLDPAGRIRWANAGLATLAGVRAEQLTDVPWRVLVHPEDRDAVTAAHQRAIATGTSFRIRHRLVHTAGERWIEEAGAPTLDEDGEVTRVVVVVDDVSTVVEFERQLRSARDDAVAAARAKSAFLADTSYEIRTALDGLIDMADALRDEDSDDTRRSGLAGLRTATTQLGDMLDNVHDLAALDAGRLELDESAFDVTAAARDVVERIAPDAVDKGLRIHADVDDVPPTVRGPELQLRQVLESLLRNAIRSTGDGEIRLTATVVDEQDHRVAVRFAVTDTGRGVPEAMISTMFDPFAQSDGSPLRAGGAAGLELAMTRRLVEMMGGRLGVESTADQGSRFTFVVSFDALPAAEPGQATDRARGELPADGPASPDSGAISAGHLLVVEDNPINQEVARELLQTMGYHVAVANDGAEGVAAATDTRFAAILMDCQMPVMDGYEATARIREHEAGHGRHTPIIALTASTMVGDRQRCLAAGMDDYISKPVSAEVLADTLARWIDGRPEGGGAAVDADEGAAQPPVVDWQILHRLSVVPGLLERSRERFLANGSEEVVALRELFATGDRDALRAAAHKLKGASLTLGAVRLGGELQELEHRVDDGHEIVEDLLVTVERSFAELHEALQTPPAEVT